MMLRQIGFGVLAAVLLTTPAAGQAKPTGVYDCGDDPPAWVSLCTIADTEPDANFVSARALSQRRGVRWLLQLGYHEPPAQPIGAHAARVRARLDAAGLLPHLAGMAVGEEWYERLLTGVFAPLGLPADHPQGIEIVREWAGQQHAAAFAAIPVPVLWITTLPNNDPTFGRAWYRPVPASTHVVAVDAYIHAGGTFAGHVAPVLAHAETTTALPLVLIPQWFHIPGDPLWSYRPTTADLDAYAAWAARPRWIATLGFTWRSRPWAGIVGLRDLLDLRATVEQHMGRVTP